MSYLDYVGNNPGAVKYGNFINYYQFHPAEERLQDFPTNIWSVRDGRIFSCLDVGCNSGELTQALWEFISINLKSESSYSEGDDEPKTVDTAKSEVYIDIGCVILAIDLDDTLITRAVECNPRKDNISFITCNFMDENELCLAVKNFHLDGAQESCYQQRFDAVFLFSVTMWIHLNYGDNGFRKLILNAASLSRNLVIVEPQRWKCYAAANRRCTRSGGKGFSFLSELTLRDDVAIENELDQVLSECGFKKIAQSKKSKWDRKILFYQKFL